MAIRYYIDNNCLSGCLWPGIQGWTIEGVSQVRTRVLSAIKADAAIVLGSAYHLEEASRIPLFKRRTWMPFFWNCVGCYFLRPTNELVKSEVQAGSSLQYNEPFDTYNRRQCVRRGCLTSASLLDAIAKEVQQQAEKFGEAQKKRTEIAKQFIKKTYPNISAQEVSDAWWSKAAHQIEDWVRDYLGASRKFLELSEDENSWPAPRQLRMTWAMHAYQMARIVRMVGYDQPPKHSDGYDAHHYADMTRTITRWRRSLMSSLPKIRSFRRRYH